MIKLRERLDSLEAIMAAIDGYQHLPVDTLSHFLLENYTIDLDLLAELASALEVNASGSQALSA